MVTAIIRNTELISEDGMKLLKKRYLDGPNDSVNAMFKRVSLGNPLYEEMLTKLLMLPNSPTLFNAGKNNGCTLSACFTFVVGDYMLEHEGKVRNDSIVRTREKAISVAKAGGGVGYYGGFLRAKNSPIKSVHRRACGPVGVMRDYQGVSDLITQGGKRELAQMFMLPAYHEDIEKFIDSKATPDKASHLSSFNISVCWNDENIHDAFNNPTDVGRRMHDLWWKQCEAAWATGCPGMFFHDSVNKKNQNKHIGLIWNSNPCQPADALLLTPDGMVRMRDVKVGTTVWSGKKWTKVIRKLTTGVKEVFEYRTTAGKFVGTEDHQVFECGIRVKAKDADSIDRCIGPKASAEWDNQDIMDGWLIGDGMVHKATNRILLCVGEKDGDIHEALPELIVGHRPTIKDIGWEVRTTVTRDELPRTWHREVPERFLTGDSSKVCGFLRGLYSANGSVCDDRITLKTSSRQIADDVQAMLSSVGIPSYVTTNKASMVMWDNGEYESRQSYDVNVTRGRSEWLRLIGFVQRYKQDRARAACEGKREGSYGKNTFDVVSVTSLGKMPVYDITVEAEEHSYWTSCLLVSNCGEAFGRNDEACNLLSLVASRFVDLKTRQFDFDYWAHCSRIGNAFLDDILSANMFPHPDITAAVLKTRRLGMGIMGWADTLALMGIHYSTQTARDLADKVWSIAMESAHMESVERGEKYGPYPGFDETKTEGPCRRNEVLGSIAPNGSIGPIADAWGGIEPFYRLGNVERTTAEGMKLYGGMPKWIEKNLDGFVPETADKISVEDHVLMQAAFQKHTCLGVSKTINMPYEATVEDVSNAYKLMYDTGCMGGTIFREGCRPDQVLREKPKAKNNVYMEVKQMNDEIDAVVKPHLEQISRTSSALLNGTHRRKLPKTRSSTTHKFRIVDTEGYLTVGLYDDGMPGEIFIRFSKVGSTIAGLLDGWAMTFSTALQYGAPLSSLCKLLKGHRFEPAGLTDDKEIKVASSIMDYVVRWLELNYLTVREKDAPVVEVPCDSGIYCPECEGEMIYQSGCLLCTKSGCGFSRCG